jgi:hypothetical protein
MGKDLILSLMESKKILYFVVSPQRTGMIFSVKKRAGHNRTRNKKGSYTQFKGKKPGFEERKNPVSRQREKAAPLQILQDFSFLLVVLGLINQPAFEQAVQFLQPAAGGFVDHIDDRPARRGRVLQVPGSPPGSRPGDKSQKQDNTANKKDFWDTDTKHADLRLVLLYCK